MTGAAVTRAVIAFVFIVGFVALAFVPSHSSPAGTAIEIGCTAFLGLAFILHVRERRQQRREVSEPRSNVQVLPAQSSGPGGEDR